MATENAHQKFAAIALVIVMALGLWQVVAALARIDFGEIPSTPADFREGRSTGKLQRKIEDNLPWRDAMIVLPTLFGPAQEVLARARAELPDTPAIANSLAALDALAASAAPDVEALHIDLADLRGYHYHNGAIFSVFTAGVATAVGNGGRYDGIGKAFGRARPATGFTLDLRQLADVVAQPAA